METLDYLLSIISRVLWILWIIFVIIYFFRNLFRRGLIRAILNLFSAQILLTLFGVIFVGLLSWALVFVPPTQVGVVVSLLAPGGVRPQPLRPGLHLITPGLEFEYQYPTYWQTYTMSNMIDETDQEPKDDSIRGRTKDGQEVRLSTSVIFRLDREQAVTVHVDWQNRYTQDFVRPVIRGYVRTQVSQFTVQEVNSNSRKDLETTLNRILTEEFANKGLIMDQFVVRDIAFTDDYSHSIEQKQIAQEGKERTEHEAQQKRNLAEGERDRLSTEAQGQKEKLILEAEGRAKGILAEAEAQADGLKLISEALTQNSDLLTYRYIDKLSPNIRAMLVPNNAPLILPLQDLASDLNLSAPITGTVTGPTVTQESLVPTSIDDAQ